jgi:uracil-DNA glycosylase
MHNSKRVLSDLNGTWDAQIVFVAEAPGRLGAEITGIPLFGDRTGDRFEELLKVMDWNRSDVFITNAVLCNPRDERGNNDTPNRCEIANCSQFLRRTIELINPLLVVALGRIALASLKTIADHQCDLRTCAGKIMPWGARRLGVLYHPGPRTAVHRSWEMQLCDARRLATAAGTFLNLTRTSNVPEKNSLFDAARLHS